MIPVQFPEANCILGNDQDEYEPLPAHIDANAPEIPITFCCRLSDVEIEDIVRYRTLYFTQLTFGRQFQPIALTTRNPFK